MESPDEVEPEPIGQAFLALRAGDRAWLVDLPRGEVPLIGAGAEAIAPPSPDETGGVRVRWDGAQIHLDRDQAGPEVVVNGKRLEGAAQLRPGDEVTVGPLRLVVGMASARPGTGRRALTHREFRERLAEELARAGRRSRPTTLLMVRARAGEGRPVMEAALEHFRAGDLVAAYAPDEVELLLPDTTEAQARAVLERVLAARHIEGYRVGVAVAPTHADTRDQLLWASRRALDRAATSGERFRAPPRDVKGPARTVAQDPASRALMTRLQTLAADRAPVLFTGEPSSGRRRFAEDLHRLGPLPERPFVVLRCGAPLGDRPSAARLADTAAPGPPVDALRDAGGTLLLEEVCDLPLEAQGELVRLLDELGPSVRRLATTHLHLASLAARGAFSEPLQAALDGSEVDVPPLRNRPEDLLPLAERFATEAGAEAPVRLTPGALARLRSHPWPGNVLELRNAMERAVRLAHGGEIVAEHLPTDGLSSPSGEGRLREHVDSIERDAIIQALAAHNHNQTHAAKRLGISRRALIYKMEKYGLKPPPNSARR